MSERVHVGKFGRNFVDAFGIDAKALIGRQGFARDFQKNAFEDGSWHEKSRSFAPHPIRLNAAGWGLRSLRMTIGYKEA